MIKKYSGVIALLISVICWGPAPVVSKIALTQIPEISFAFLSRTLAFIILFVLFFPKGYFKISKNDLKLFFFAGLTGAVLNVYFFLLGLQHTTAMNSQAIFTVAPVMTAILAHIFLNEKIKPIQMFAVFIGFLGAIVIALRDLFETGNFNPGNFTGNLLILLAAFSWVIYILVSKKLSKNYSPISITCYSFLVSSLIFAPFFIFDFIQSSTWISKVGIEGIFGIAYQAVFASVIAFSAYQIGLKLTSAFTAGVALYLNPVITTIVAAIVLKERISNPFIVGTILIITGSLIATQYATLKNHYHRIRKSKLI